MKHYKLIIDKKMTAEDIESMLGLPANSITLHWDSNSFEMDYPDSVTLTSGQKTLIKNFVLEKRYNPTTFTEST